MFVYWSDVIVWKSNIIIVWKVNIFHCNSSKRYGNHQVRLVTEIIIKQNERVFTKSFLLGYFSRKFFAQKENFLKGFPKNFLKGVFWRNFWKGFFKVSSRVLFKSFVQGFSKSYSRNFSGFVQKNFSSKFFQKNFFFKMFKVY